MNEPLVDTITFGIGTGLDSDSDELTIKPGDSPVDPSVYEDGRLNVEIREGNLNVAANALGNAVQSHALPAGTNTILGWCEDKENNGIIYFVHNSNDDHCIIRYKFDGTFNNISYAESGWPFNADYPINKSGVIGTGNDAMLTWTDNNANPGKILIRSVEYNVYSALDNGKIYMIKPMPADRPAIVIGSDASVFVNNIRGKLFQFAYRYIYDTGEKSAVSFYSDVLYNYEDEFISGTYSKNMKTANKITLTLDVDYDNIEKLEIFFRIVDTGDGVAGNWVICDTVTATSPTTTYDFYNDGYYSSADQTIFDRLEDSVPIKARTQEVINENRMVYGGVTKGYDQVTPNVSLFCQTTNTMSIAYNYDRQTIANGNTYDFTFVHDSTERYNIVIINTLAGAVETYVLDSDSNYADLDAVVDYFVDKITADTSYTITASNAASKLRIVNNTGASLGVNQNYYIKGDKYRTMKGGATAYFALQYYDFAGRSSRVIKSDDTKIYITHQCEYNGANLNNYDSYLQGVRYTINHLPLSWATHYQWLFGGTNIENYFCIPLIIDETDYNGLSSDIARVDDLIRIDFDAVQNRFTNRYYNENRITFDPVAGDRIRITGQQFGLGVKLFNEMMDFEILSVDTSGSNYYLYIPSWDSYVNKANIDGAGAIYAEFYRTKEIDEDNIVYREVGEVLPISGGNHTATGSTLFGITKQDQSGLGTPAIGYIDFGDSYKFEMEGYRVTSASTVYSFYLKNNLESKSSSLLYDSEHNGVGRLTYFDSNYKQTYYNALQWGGAFSNENITFNEINVFSGSDMKYIDEKYGLIYGLEEEGFVLNVVQQSKLTMVDIKRISQQLPDGTTSYVATDEVLGTKRPMVENAGCIFPRAIVRNNRYLYYPDIYSGEIYRKAPNGQTPISDYGMSNFFRYTFNNILEKGVENITMTAGWDPINKMYVLTMLTDASGSQSIGGSSVTVAFHEPSNRWYTFYSFKPQVYAKIGEGAFLSFSDSVLYKHHSTAADRNTFYGTPYESKLAFVSNRPQDTVKEFEVIEEIGNEIWEAPDDDSIVINPDATETQDVKNYTKHHPKMQSELPEGQFRPEDGVFFAKFLRDSTTTTGSPYRLDLINGRPLVGNAMKVKLENDSTTDVFLKIVKIHSSNIY